MLTSSPSLGKPNPHSERVVAIVTLNDPSALREVAREAREAALRGATVRVFFRDLSIPAICRPAVAERLGLTGDPGLSGMLERLVRAGDVRLYACSSSLYLWGVTSGDLLPSIQGARGLIAFLVEDLSGATRVLSR